MPSLLLSEVSTFIVGLVIENNLHNEDIAQARHRNVFDVQPADVEPPLPSALRPDSGHRVLIVGAEHFSNTTEASASIDREEQEHRTIVVVGPEGLAQAPIAKFGRRPDTPLEGTVHIHLVGGLDDEESGLHAVS